MSSVLDTILERLVVSVDLIYYFVTLITSLLTGK